MKVFPRDVIIKFDDILNLKLQINEKLEQYEVIAKEEKMAVKYDNNTFKEYNDWVVFREELKISSLPIDSINIIWDVMIKMTNYEIPQRHTIALRFCSGLKPAQIIQMMVLGTLEDIDSIDQNTFPVSCKVDCVNNLIGEEILQIVEKWNKGLELASKDPIFYRKFRKYREEIGKIIKYSFKIIVLLLICIYLCYNISKFNVDNLANINLKNLSSLILKLPFIYFFFIFFSGIGNILEEKLNEAFYRYGETHNFLITKGDKNKQNELSNKNNKNKNTIIKTSLSIIANLIIGIFASVIAGKII